MAACIDDLIDNAITEQMNELELLQSMYEDNFHWIQKYDQEDNTKIEFNLTLSIRHPHEKVTVEAVIPLQIINNEASLEHDSKDGLEDERSVEESEQANANAGEQNGEIDGPCSSKKPGLSRLLSTKHLHIMSDVSELTPMNLWCQLPLLYPSEEPPQMILSCDWLSSCQIDKLSKELDKMWQDSKPDPILFTWVDWLQNSSWEFLQLTSHIVLREGFKDCPFKDGVTDVALEMALFNIFEHDLELTRKTFYKSSHTCEICFEEKDGKEFCFFDECHHYCCLDCLTYHCNMHIKSGSVLQLLCPINNCDVDIPPPVLKDLVEESTYKRWEQLLLNKTLDLMSDVFYCPRCNTPAVAEDDVHSSKLARCANCFFSFCIECQSLWHPGKPCFEEELDEAQPSQQKETKKKIPSTVAEKSGGKGMMQKSTIQFINMMKTKGAYKNCPKCRTLVEKNMGCNHMRCSQCTSCFCWRCGKLISSYGHFSDSPQCAQIVDVTLPPARQPQPTQGDLMLQEYREKNPHKRVIRKCCPTCSQKNIKVANNNSMKCWSCKTRFCYQCGKILDGPANKHFMPPSSCTQHSDD